MNNRRKTIQTIMRLMEMVMKLEQQRLPAFWETLMAFIWFKIMVVLVIKKPPIGGFFVWQLKQILIYTDYGIIYF